ncbi:GL24603 [Drosophila persimilis]|uniref:GL24603 n=1 Tax=Drosophila persimilis TaxID=7234 RepID=B4H5X5_DROPE|nr:GL24603 [Drosophila persimilis]
MSDRYQAGYYDHHQHTHSHSHHPHPHTHPHPHPYPHQTAMSHYPPQPYRSGYPGYHPYPSGYSYGSASSSYMPNYYRYAAYASPHYSQPHAHPHQGMFTPAGQQLIPSSVLHYPPRSHPQAHPYQQQQHQQQHPQQHPQQPQQHQQQSSYEQPPPSLYSSSASSSAYGQTRGFGGYTGDTPHYAFARTVDHISTQSNSSPTQLCRDNRWLHRAASAPAPAPATTVAAVCHTEAGRNRCPVGAGGGGRLTSTKAHHLAAPDQRHGHRQRDQQLQHAGQERQQPEHARLQRRVSGEYVRGVGLLCALPLSRRARGGATAPAAAVNGVGAGAGGEQSDKCQGGPVRLHSARYSR